MGPDHRVAYWDAEAEILTGVLAGEAVGMPCYEVVAGRREDCRFCEKGCSVIKLARAGHAVPSYEMRLSTQSGRGDWVGVSILSVDAEDGTYVVHLLHSTEKDHRTLEMARGLIEISRKGQAVTLKEPAVVPEITVRQREVLDLLAEGKTVKEIQGRLYLSQATVRNHVRALLQALDAHSQLEAVVKARKMGLLAG